MFSASFYNEENCELTVCVESRPTLLCAKALLWRSDWHSGICVPRRRREGVGVVAASRATTNPARAFRGQGGGPQRFGGLGRLSLAFSPQRKPGKSGGHAHSTHSPAPGPQVPAPGLGIRALMTESAACPVLCWGKKIYQRSSLLLGSPPFLVHMSQRLSRCCQSRRVSSRGIAFGLPCLPPGSTASAGACDRLWHPLQRVPSGVVGLCL